MTIIVYTKSGCPNCDAAKALLRGRGLRFEERNIDDLDERIAFTLAYPDIRQMPQIVVDGQRLGGYEGLRQQIDKIARGVSA